MMDGTIQGKHSRSIRRTQRADLELLARDKNLSCTDCTSFVVMEELRIRKALTLDRHFTQVGFEVVPGAGTQ